ncbi:MAG: SxtJ family membrane protein, partial [Ignavibacteriaceae bacterium]
MLKEEIKHIKQSKKDLQKFGLTVGIALLVISVILFLFDKPAYLYFGIIGGALILTGLIIPNALKSLNKVWMTLALLLGWFTSKVILTILFYIVLTPIGFIAKIFGKRFLSLKIDNEAKT